MPGDISAGGVMGKVGGSGKLVTLGGKDLILNYQVLGERITNDIGDSNQDVWATKYGAASNLFLCFR